MLLPDSYTLKPNAVPAYFDAILAAQAPERFSLKFLENLGFTSTNDRLFIGILKDLGFLNRDGAPQTRYFEFLDRSRSRQVLAAGIREAFAGLFGINTRANELPTEEVKNKLRTLYAGKKTDLVISNISKTFRALCDYADFSEAPTNGNSNGNPDASAVQPSQPMQPEPASQDGRPAVTRDGQTSGRGKITVSGLQYHINIVLPDTRDQAVYDAIFKSLREHLA